MKLIIKNAKPRNPFVAASMRRNSGAHAKSASARRKTAGRELQRELQRMKQHSP